MRLLLLFFVLYVPFIMSAQEPEIKRERVFSGDGLYGFMNGGAELYHEYGFKSLVNRDIVYKGEAYTVDVFEMPSREDAFGIYSVNVYRCQQADTMGYINCISPYQLQAVVENYYVSIVFPSGSTKAQQLAGELIPLFLSGKRSSIDIPEDIASSPPFSGVVKYLRGPISVSGASSDLAAILKDITYRGIWFRADRQTKSYKAAILFASPQALEQFQQSIPTSDTLRSENETIIIRRNEIEKTPANGGEFGF